jgi:hypothetical protein
VDGVTGGRRGACGRFACSADFGGRSHVPAVSASMTSASSRPTAISSASTGCVSTSSRAIAARARDRSDRSASCQRSSWPGRCRALRAWSPGQTHTCRGDTPARLPRLAHCARHVDAGVCDGEFVERESRSSPYRSSTARSARSSAYLALRRDSALQGVTSRGGGDGRGADERVLDVRSAYTDLVAPGGRVAGVDRWCVLEWMPLRTGVKARWAP